MSNETSNEIEKTTTPEAKPSKSGLLVVLGMIAALVLLIALNMN